MIVVASEMAIGRYLYSGERLWKNRYDGLVRHLATTETGILASVEQGDYGNQNGLLVRLAMASGGESWRKELGHGLVSAEPVVTGDQALIGCTDGRIRCIDLRDGTTAWTSGYLWGSVTELHLSRPGTFVIAVSAERRLAAVDLVNGETLWADKFHGAVTVLRTYLDSLLVHRLTSSNAVAAVYKAELDSGNLIGRVGTKGIIGRPLLTGDDQVIFRVPNKAGTDIWKTDFSQKTHWRMTLPGTCHNDGSVIGQTAVFVHDHGPSVVGIDTTNGKVRWSHSLPDRVMEARPLRSGGQICLLTDGTVLEVEPLEGAEVWRTKVLRGEQLAIADTVICVAERRQLYVVRT